MYDDQYLYIGAHVRDPLPLKSVIPPDADSTYCYRGGSVQVRIATDPSKPWPLPQYYRPDRIPHYPADVDLDFMVHLSMWYHAPSNGPCLDISYGVPPLKSHSSPAFGWQGAYQKDADGLGYMLEYAIPWHLIQDKEKRFQAGDQTAVCWQVNWSNREGNVRVAQLNECVNMVNIQTPNDLMHAWRQAESWGRGIFQGQDGSKAREGCP